MSNVNKTFNTIKHISFLTQFGFSVITPILLCIFCGIWIRNKFGLGDWIVFIAIIIGLISAFYSSVSIFSYIFKEAKKSEEEEKNE